MKQKSTPKVMAYRAKKHAEGWKYLNFLLPPEVKEKVLLYQRQLMAEYKYKQSVSKV